MRFVSLLCVTFFCATFFSCHERKEKSSTHIHFDNVAAWSKKEYSLSHRRIRSVIDRLRRGTVRMYADEFTHGYYASEAPFLWITRQGVDNKADTLLAHIKETRPIGLHAEVFHIAELEENLRRIRQLDFDHLHDINTVFGRTEYLLTEAYLRYVCGQRFGYVKPGIVFNRLEKADITPKSPFIKLFDVDLEQANEDFISRSLACLNQNTLSSFLKDTEPDAPLYRQLTALYNQTQDSSLRRKIVANIERSRWRPTYTQHRKHIRVNLAGATLQAINEETQDSLYMKICYGSRKNKTPLLHSRIERIDMNPYWNIPFSIIKKEIAPRHAGDAAYFARNRYRILDKESGKELSPEKVSASMLLSGDYRIRQDNGEGNSLGRLIFRFPNNFSIYLHDTNNKQAFKRKDRAISHGCIRVEKPLELAVFLLEEPDEKTVNKLRKAIGLPLLNEPAPQKKKEEEDIKTEFLRLKPTIPVFIEYRTLCPKKDGEWEEHPDPYGYDEILLKKLESF